MEAAATLLTGAVVALGLAKWLNAPAIPFLLVTGVLLARVGLLDPVELRGPLTLGATFLLFVGGIELNPSRVGKHRRAALRVGAAQFALLGLAGFGAALLLGFGRLTSLYLALALTASSTLVVVGLLQRRQQLFEPFGRLVLGVLLLQDLLVILMIPLVTRATEGIGRALIELAATIAMTGLAFACLRWVGPWLLRLGDDEESVLIVTLAFLFVFLGIAELIGVPLISAAFLAGVGLSAFPVRGVVRGQLDSISDFFNAIFFTALGGIIVLPGLRELGQALVLSIVVVVFTPPLVAIVAERAGFSARPAIESGLLLSQTSELSLIVALQGMLLQQVGADVFTIVALVTALTMLLTPLISASGVTRWVLRFHPLRRDTLIEKEPDQHVVLLGCGEAGMPLLETLLSSGNVVVVVDDDPGVIARLREGGVPSIRGDALDPEVLHDAAVSRAVIVSSTVRRPRDNRLLFEVARGVPILVRVFEDDDAEWVRAHGGIPILSSEAAAKAFLRWFDTNVQLQSQATSLSAAPRPSAH